MATIGTFKQPGAIIDVKATKSLAYHELIAVGSIYAVTKASADVGEIVACNAEGVFQFPKKASEAITQGAKVYLDTSGGITGTAGDDSPVGIAWADAAADDTIVTVKINV